MSLDGGEWEVWQNGPVADPAPWGWNRPELRSQLQQGTVLEDRTCWYIVVETVTAEGVTADCGFFSWERLQSYRFVIHWEQPYLGLGRDWKRERDRIDAARMSRKRLASAIQRAAGHEVPTGWKRPLRESFRRQITKLRVHLARRLSSVNTTAKRLLPSVGTPQTSHQLTCPECSHANDANEWYCTRCGGELRAEESCAAVTIVDPD